jgi:VanZ family protein
VTEAGTSPLRSAVRRAWLLWGAAILFFSVAPPGWILGAVPRSGWSFASSAGHVFEFGLFALLFWLSLPAGHTAVRRAAESAVVSLAFGLAIELIQLPISYRSFDLLDWAADAAGIAAVLLVLSASRSLRAGTRPRRR